ncbi:hypothetical protein QS306_09310 [Paraburkholderia bonniea]|uniref:hypothetical protein n=1 Tax=Paraburkholderia bonniea TaxID=2152891 RepID=UPI002572794A|nr:hypothetical protein [Paraburkholderia bonniea]WJF89320.1 hypothetical protein QS306_09310 [Paraburkholderia bonniea]WJF92636.1 hypothetical protein QS308_09320 [Paraburkholderia bonniea]
MTLLTDIPLSSAGHVSTDADADTHDLLATLGFMYWRHGRSRQAQVLFDTLHLCGDNSATTAALRALMRIDTNAPEEALAIIEHISDADAQLLPILLLLRAETLSELGHKEAAAEAMQHFLDARMQQTALDAAAAAQADAAADPDSTTR